MENYLFDIPLRGKELGLVDTQWLWYVIGSNISETMITNYFIPLLLLPSSLPLNCSLFDGSERFCAGFGVIS